MIERLKAFLDRLWFTPVPAARLAWVRVFVGGFATWYLHDQRASLVHTAGGAAAVFHPIGVVSYLTKPISPNVYDLLIGIALALGVCFVLGIWHRVLAPIFAGLLMWVVTYSNSWSMVFHTENMLVLHVLILGVTGAARAVSVDALVTARWPVLSKWGFSARASQPHYGFAWPLRCLQLAATLPYVVAGLAKVRGDMGWSWTLGQNLRDQITMNGLYYDVLSGGAMDITYHVFEPRFTALFVFAASMTLVVELLAPLALLHRYAGYAYVVGVMSMHWSILWLMGIPFRYQLYGFAFASFFAFDRLADGIVRLLKRLVSRAKKADVVAVDVGAVDPPAEDAAETEPSPASADREPTAAS